MIIFNKKLCQMSIYLSLDEKPPGALSSCLIYCLRLDLFSGNWVCMKATKARHSTLHLRFKTVNTNNLRAKDTKR